MARRNNLTDLEPLPDVDDDALEQNLKMTAAEVHRLMEIDATFGDGKPYELNRVSGEIDIITNRMGEDAYELGKRLILIKEHEGHGKFLSILGQKGVAPRMAQQFMRVAVKFPESNAKALAHLGRSKLIELATEDAEDIEALAEGGTLAGLTLDDIDRMSVRELKETLRKERANLEDERETHEQLLAKKNQKVDELHRKLHADKKRAQTWNARAFEIAQESTTHAFTALQSLDQLHVLRDVILTEEFDGDDREAAVPAMAKVYYHAVQELFKEASRLLGACEEVFVGYVDEPTPLIEMGDVFGAQAGDAGA